MRGKDYKPMAEEDDVLLVLHTDPYVTACYILRVVDVKPSNPVFSKTPLPWVTGTVTHSSRFHGRHFFILDTDAVKVLKPCEVDFFAAFCS